MAPTPVPEQSINPSSSRRTIGSDNGSRGLRVCDNCQRKKSKCNMARPKCQSCLDSEATCTYTTLKRKPGPRKGSTNVREQKFQAQLDRFERILQQRQQDTTPQPRGNTASPQNPEPQVVDLAPSDGFLSLSSTRSQGMGFENWMNDIPQDGSEMDSILNTAQELEPQAANISRSEYTLPWPRVGSGDISCGNCGSSFQPSNIGDISCLNTPHIITSISLDKSNPDLAGRFDPLSHSDPWAFSLSADIEVHLISLYFTYIQPIYPLFQTASFYETYNHRRIPAALLNAMFALSARHSSKDEILNHSRGHSHLAGDIFARRANMAKANDGNTDRPITLDDLKTSFLLCVYEYTSNPGRKAWVSAGCVVRMAYELGLHQIDTPATDDIDSTDTLSVIYREERRHVWWCVWKLDAWVGISGGTPFVVDDQAVCTALVSSSPAELADSKIGLLSQMFLSSDARKVWNLMRDLQTSNEAKGYNMFIVANALMREIATIRALQSHPPSNAIKDRQVIAANALTSLRLGLPLWFFQSVRNNLEGETTVQHQRRLEVLIQFHISRLLAAFPHCPPRNSIASFLDEETILSIKLKWRTCTSHAEDVVHIFRDWAPEYFGTVSPETSSSIWIAGIVLIVQTIIGGEMDSQERSRLLSSIDVLTLSLQQLAHWWHFCHAMLDSLKVLRQQAFIMHNFHDVYQLLCVLQGPFNPRYTKFLKQSDYQIKRSEQTNPLQPKDSYLWPLPPQNLESFLSETGRNNLMRQGISLDVENCIGV